jgi:TonB family protein
LPRSRLLRGRSRALVRAVHLNVRIHMRRAYLLGALIGLVAIAEADEPKRVILKPGIQPMVRFLAPTGFKAPDHPPLQIVPRAGIGYPEDFRRKHQSGWVIAEFIVDKNGNVTDLKVVFSDDPELSAAVCGAVQRWKYSAGEVSGVTVETKVRVLVEFPADNE